MKTPKEFEHETGYQAIEKIVSGKECLKCLDDLLELMVVYGGHQSDQHLLGDLIKRVDGKKRIHSLLTACLFLWIKDTYHYFFPNVGDQTLISILG